MLDSAEFGSKWKYFFFRDSLVNGRQYISDMKKGNNLWLFVCFVCLGLTSLLNTWDHIATVPACSSDTASQEYATPQTQNMTPCPVRVYRHRADLSLCCPLMWYVTLEYTTTNFNVLGKTRPGNLPRSSRERSTLWCCYGGSQLAAR